MSGTIVERRDQVLTTFFSLRVFSPSTFSRKWSSTNGPFFSERAIAPLFLFSSSLLFYATQAAPLGMPRLLESAYRARNAMRLRTERAHKASALRVRSAIYDHRPSRFAQLVEHRLWRDYHFLDDRSHRLRRVLHGCAFGYTLHSPGGSPAVAACGSCCSCSSHDFALTG